MNPNRARLQMIATIFIVVLMEDGLSIFLCSSNAFLFIRRFNQPLLAPLRKSTTKLRSGVHRCNSEKKMLTASLGGPSVTRTKPVNPNETMLQITATIFMIVLL